MTTEDEDRPGPRTPGTRWRVLAHLNERAVELENQGVIDEVVIDDWLHLEQMSERQWWMRLGDARIWVHIDDDGRVRVDVERGCYELERGTTTDLK